MTAHQDAFASWFSGRRWRVATEATCVRDTPDGDRVTYEQGEFWVSEPAVYQTPLGRRGRHGFILQEVDEAGSDIPGSRAAFGATALRRAFDLFGSIINMPVLRRHPVPRGLAG